MRLLRPDALERDVFGGVDNAGENARDTLLCDVRSCGAVQISPNWSASSERR
jgi:hypothetical protein